MLVSEQLDEQASMADAVTAAARLVVDEVSPLVSPADAMRETRAWLRAHARRCAVLRGSRETALNRG
jgi:hypothetical protein